MPWYSWRTFTPGSSGSIPSATATGESAGWRRTSCSSGTGYPPAVIHKRDRTRYLNALRRADRRDAGPLAEILARAVTDGIYRFLLPGLAGPHRLVPLRSLADSELSGNALAVAAKRGRLRAVRQTDQWYSTKLWVEEYKERRYKRA